MGTPSRFPEPHDLVSVTERQVEYFGYVDAVDYDLRCPRVQVEFLPGICRWFDLSEVTRVKFPERVDADASAWVESIRELVRGAA